MGHPADVRGLILVHHTPHGGYKITALVREVRVDQQGTSAPTTVVIFDGDPVIGRALELLLQADADYSSVRYMDESSLEQPGALEEVRVVLLGPRWSARSREAITNMVESMPATVRIPVLEVGIPADDTQVEPENYVPWPCQMEDLKRRIDAALFAGPGADNGI